MERHSLILHNYISVLKILTSVWFSLLTARYRSLCTSCHSTSSSSGKPKDPLFFFSLSPILSPIGLPIPPICNLLVYRRCQLQSAPFVCLSWRFRTWNWNCSLRRKFWQKDLENLQERHDLKQVCLFLRVRLPFSFNSVVHSAASPVTWTYDISHTTCDTSLPHKRKKHNAR